MKTERRHALQTNQLADWLSHKVKWCEDHGKLLMGAVVLAIAGVALYFYWSYRSEQQAESSWNAFFSAVDDDFKNDNRDALTALAKDHAGTPAGVRANLRLADDKFKEGNSLLSSNREAAYELLNQAKNHFEAVRATADDELLTQVAVLGMARYFETMGMVDDAKREYETLKKWDKGLYTALADAKLQILPRTSTQTFYDQYKSYAPPKPVTPAPQASPAPISTLPDFPASSPSAPVASPTADAAPAASPSASVAATPSAPESAATPAPVSSPSPTASPSPTK